MSREDNRRAGCLRPERDRPEKPTARKGFPERGLRSMVPPAAGFQAGGMTVATFQVENFNFGQRERLGMSKKRRKGAAEKAGGVVRLWALAGGAALVVLVAGVVLVNPGLDSETQARAPRGGETNAILSPQYFSGAAQVAYSVAQQHAELLDHVFCFCECGRAPLLHKSLRTCFATTHGAG